MNQFSDVSRSRLLPPIALLVLFLSLLPILVTHHLPLLDAPGHESRLAVLRDLVLRGGVSKFYDLNTFFLPNVAFDVVGLGLIGFVGPEMAGKIFFGVTLTLTLSGVSVLNRVVTGRWSFTPLVGSLLLYNLVSVLGFFSYIFGFALALWALAGWLLLRPGSPLRHHIFSAMAAIVLLFCHAFDFGIYALMVGGFLLAGLIANRTGLGRAMAGVAALVQAIILYMLMGHGSGGPIRYEPGIVAAKILGLVKCVTCGSIAGDLAFMVGAVLFLVLATFCGRSRLQLGFLLGLAGLALLYLILPDKLSGGSYVDKRMPIAFLFLLLAGLDLRIRESRVASIVICLIGATIVFKQAALIYLWRSFDPTIDRMSQALDMLPAGAIILQAECEPDSGVLGVYQKRQPSLPHVPAMAAFDDTKFVASTWAIAGQQTIQVRDIYRNFYDLQESFGPSTCSENGYRSELEHIRDLVRRQDTATATALPVYFILIRPTSADPLHAEAPLIASGPMFSLYKVEL